MIIYSWQISAGALLPKLREFFANHNAEFSSRSLFDVTQSVILVRSKASLGKFSKFSYPIKSIILKIYLKYI
jgi:hypothetical protein